MSVFCALKGFVRLEFLRFKKLIQHWYEPKRNLFIRVIRETIMDNTDYQHPVNA